MGDGTQNAKYWRNKLKRMINESKTITLTNLMEENKHDTCTIVRKHLLELSPKSSSKTPVSIELDDKATTDSETFNKHFTEMAENIEKTKTIATHLKTPLFSRAKLARLEVHHHQRRQNNCNVGIRMVSNLLVHITYCHRKPNSDRYRKFKVLRVDVEKELNLKVMKRLHSQGEFDFWNFPRDLMVSPEQLEYVHGVFAKYGMDYHVMIDNVQSLIDNQVSKRTQPSIHLSDYDFTRYYDLSEIENWVKEMAETYPSLVTDFVVGPSFEGREMRALKVGSSENSSKKAVWFHGGIHAREWISPAVTMFMTNQLVVDYDTDPDVRKYLDTYDFYILPVMNPDGYEYTWVENRMWRKTRSPNEGSECIGTDANRNFNYTWGCEYPGVTDPCANDYGGSEAHSESEVLAVTDYIIALNQTQQVTTFIDIHSYSQLWLTPWAYTDNYNPVDYPDQIACANDACAALEAVHGTVYQYGSIFNLFLGEYYGMSIDWGYGASSIKYSYLIELRDTGEFGFLLPDEQIIPSGEETYAGLKALLECILTIQ
ncbi:carboxypeptidase B-like [Glandiceps talaboti]